MATRTNEEDDIRPKREGRTRRTDGWMGRSSCRGVAHSNHSIDLSHNDMRGISHDEDESAPRQRFIVMASHSLNDIAWLQEAR